jgi:hypothetical protein
MKNLKLLKFLLVIVLAGFAACSDENADTEVPEITLHSPADHDHFHKGDEILFDVTLTDNIALRQLKVDIHYGGDHTHKKSRPAGELWDFDTIINLSGRSARITFPIAIPADIEEGEYHLSVYVTDESGNEAFEVVDIEIEDDDDDHD